MSVPEWVGVDGVFFFFLFFGGGVASIPLLDDEKCSAAEMNSKVGGEPHGFHDYQVLWLACGFGSIVT